MRLTVRLLLDLPPTEAQPDADADAATAAPAPTPGAEVHARAVRLADALAPEAAPADVATLARLLALHPLDDHPFTWQAAYEGHYRRDLLASLTPHPLAPTAPHTQVVLCIDPRSEGLRRHLETDAGIETFGFAGFFGVPVRFATYEGRGSIDSLPALLQPKHAVTEEPADADRARARTRGLRALDAASHSLHVTENATATPFALAEATGFLFGVSSVVRTLAPTLHHTLTRRWRDRIAPPVDSRVTIASAFTVEERATLAEAGLRMMGLGRFAPLVVLAGHGSVSTNNLYQAALDCGACGGNPGAVNARAAAEIFNDPEVRALLAARGLEIPAGTHFVAALHDTVADRVTILDRHLIPDSHATLVDDFTTRADAAADGLVRERAADLPGADPMDSLAKLRARAHDWAEVYPELGLAGNAAMIIGPREMTRSVNLRRRVFLHSYDATLDPEGAGLETILTAPVVVAQWINHQYYFSDPQPRHPGCRDEDDPQRHRRHRRPRRAQRRPAARAPPPVGRRGRRAAARAAPPERHRPGADRPRVGDRVGQPGAPRPVRQRVDQPHRPLHGRRSLVDLHRPRLGSDRDPAADPHVRAPTLTRTETP